MKTGEKTYELPTETRADSAARFRTFLLGQSTPYGINDKAKQAIAENLAAPSMFAAASTRKRKREARKKKLTPEEALERKKMSKPIDETWPIYKAFIAACGRGERYSCTAAELNSYANQVYLQETNIRWGPKTFYCQMKREGFVHGDGCDASTKLHGVRPPRGKLVYLPPEPSARAAVPQPQEAQPQAQPQAEVAVAPQPVAAAAQPVDEEVWTYDQAKAFVEEGLKKLKEELEAKEKLPAEPTFTKEQNDILDFLESPLFEGLTPQQVYDMYTRTATAAQ